MFTCSHTPTPVILLLLCVCVYVHAETPRVVIHPVGSPIQRTVGQQISLICSFSNDDSQSTTTPGIIWTKHGGLPRNGADVKRLDENTLSLTIVSATGTDTGIYICQVQLDGRKIQKTVDVIVIEELHFVDPTISTGHIMATAAINVSCEVVPDGSNVITIWQKVGYPNWAPGVRHRLSKNGAIIEFTSYDPNIDSGKYSCKVMHRRTGSVLERQITVGDEQENKMAFCTNMCTNVCANIYTSTHP